MSNYGHAFGAAVAPFDHLHGDIDVEFDLGHGHGHDYGHDYMDRSDDSLYDYHGNYQGTDSDASVPDTLASSSPALPPNPDHLLDSSDTDQEDDDHDELAGDEAAAAVLGQYAHYDGGGDDDDDPGDLTESLPDSDEEQEQNRNPYIGGGAYYLYDNRYHHNRGRRGYSLISGSSIRESSLASTLYLDDTPPNAAVQASSSSDGGAPSPYQSLSQTSAESRSDSGTGSDLELGSARASPQSSGSGSSTASAARQGLGDPHSRAGPSRRLSDQVDINNARFFSSPRRSSLTPTIHPNRRLPRGQLQARNQNNRHYPLARTIDSSDSSSDESGPHPHHHPRHRRTAPAPNLDSSNISLLSSDEDGTEDDTEDDNEDRSEHSLDSEQSRESSRGSPEVIDLDPYPGSSDSDAEEVEEQIRRAEQLQRLRANRVARVVRQGNRPHRSARAAALPIDLDSDLEDSDLELGANMDVDDELVEVVWDRQLNARQPTPPQRQPQRRQRAHHHNNQQGAGVDVIDLTEEPDSPVVQNHRPLRVHRIHHNHHNPDQQVPHHQARNPRRQMAQNGRTPSLARSDGSILGNPPAVIDLTSDGPDDPAREDALDLNLDVDEFDNIPANRRLPVPIPGPQRNHRRSVEFLGNIGGLGRGLLGFGNIRGFLPGLLAHIGNPHDAEVQIIGGQHGFLMNPDPLAGNPPEFNYQANGFGGFGGRQPTPKPDFEAPPAARPGFTRNTGLDRDTNEELVAVCASCDNELKYSAVGDDGGSRPAKKPRTKKDREEHHFWAVKACGHVYCKSCYDNRKKTKQLNDMGFRAAASGTSKSTKIFCAVDDCESDVTLTGAWVGIFL